MAMHPSHQKCLAIGRGSFDGTKVLPSPVGNMLTSALDIFEDTGTTRKNACNRETMRMMKIRVVIIFVIAQVVSIKYTSRRSINITVEDRAIRCNRNIAGVAK